MSGHRYSLLSQPWSIHVILLHGLHRYAPNEISTFIAAINAKFAIVSYLVANWDHKSPVQQTQLSLANEVDIV